jgi:hypothetical protein
VIEVFKREWDQLSRGKPIVASMNVYEGVSGEELVEIWNRFVFWRKFIVPKLPASPADRTQTTSFSIVTRAVAVELGCISQTERQGIVSLVVSSGAVITGDGWVVRPTRPIRSSAS